MACVGRVGQIVEVKRSGEELSVEWQIPHFFSLLPTCCYESHRFSFCDGCWNLIVHPNYESLGWVSLILQRSDAGTTKEIINAAVAMRGTSGVEKRREVEMEFGSVDGWFVSDFCWRSELWEQSPRLMPWGVLTITCHMKISGAQCRNLAMEELKESLKRLLSGGEDSDVLIKVRGKEFRAHRAILRVRSPVFEAMLTHDMAENRSGVITMEDCDPETFQHFLEYVYTGSVEMISGQNVFSLYTSSEMYDLPALKKACAEFVKNNLTVASFCDTITLAIRHDEKELRELATEFFCDNALDIIRTAEWQAFLAENPTVGNELHIKQLTRRDDSFSDM